MQTIYFYLTIPLMILVKCSEDEKCTQVEKNIYNIHGKVMKISVPLQITLCLPTTMARGSPIQLDFYSDYLKFKSKHPRIRGPEDRIARLYSNAFSFLPDTKTLILSQLDIEEVEPNAFRGLQNLMYLNLYSNHLKSIPEDAFNDVPNLVELNLNDNRLETLSAKQFERLTKLETLRLSNNQLQDLPADLFATQDLLVYLSLTKNRLSSLKTDTFKGLNNLQELKLLMNDLGLVDEDSFKGVPKLQHLALEYNQMIIFFDVSREFANMPSLKRLSVSPGSFECDKFETISRMASRKNIEIVELSVHGGGCKSSKADPKFS